MRCLERWARLGLAALVFAASAAAEGLDASQALVCDLVEVARCDTAAACKDVSFAQIDLPPVFEVDFPASRLVSEGGQRASPITSVDALPTVFVVHGHQEQRAWTMVIDRATGQLSATVADLHGAFVIAGACADAG
jgi:hypothetical protein